MKVLLFKNEEYKWPIFENYNIEKKIKSIYVKKLDWKWLW
jgi:hypothetical protein